MEWSWPPLGEVWRELRWLLTINTVARGFVTYMEIETRPFVEAQENARHAKCSKDRVKELQRVRNMRPPVSPACSRVERRHEGAGSSPALFAPDSPEAWELSALTRGLVSERSEHTLGSFELIDWRQGSCG